MRKALLGASLVALLFFALLPTSWDSGVTKSTNGLVILLTDYGERDHYVGALKGAIYAINPHARIDSITHHVTPYNIWEGAYTLALAAKAFPRGTVFVAVVDPGVGTERRNVVLETKDGKFFVAPDNGLLTFVAEEMGIARIREIKNRAYMRSMESSSSTFHGRDIFGPVGAYLAAGIPVNQLGPEMKGFVRLKIPRAKVSGRNVLGQVVRIDVYGNVVSNISALHLQQVGIDRGSLLRVTLAGQPFQVRFVSTYGDVPEGEKLCLLESHNLLEMAINRGHLAKNLDVNVGDKLVVYGGGDGKEN